MKFDTDCVETAPQQTPKGRGFEAPTEVFDNQMEASRKGNGPRPFMSHSGPPAAPAGIDRGQFSVRSKLTSR